MQTTEKLTTLREKLRDAGMDGYVVTTGDFHGSEYVGSFFKTRAWLSGFTGSAGTLVVLPERAALWTDGRYFLQAGQQLAGSTIENDYNLMIRDYASDSSEENAARIREQFAKMKAQDLTNPHRVAEVLGYDDLDEDSVMTPLGLRTLSQVSVVRDGVAERIVD